MRPRREPQACLKLLDVSMTLGVPVIGDGCREPIPRVARGRPLQTSILTPLAQ